MRVASGTTSRGSNLALTDEIIDDLESQRADSTLTFSFTRRLAKRMCVS